MAALKALANSSFNSTLGVLLLRTCTLIPTSTRPRASRFCSSDRTRGSTSPKDCGSRSCKIEKTMVHGPHRDRDGGALVLVRQRGEAGHGFDHWWSVFTEEVPATTTL